MLLASSNKGSVSELIKFVTTIIKVPLEIESSSTTDICNGSEPYVLLNNGKSRKSFLPQLFAAFAASISAFSMGMVESYTSPALPSMAASSKLGHISTNDQTRIASIALLAALLSAPQIGYLVGKIGRKAVLIISGLPFVVGWLLIASTTYLPMVFLGRFITGFCAGAASLVVPIYIGEVSDDHHRGFLCSLFQLSATVGNFFVYVVGTALDWRWLALACGLVPLAGILLIATVPDSPTFLLSKDRQEDAIYALMWLRGADNLHQVEPELNAIQNNILACNAEGKSYKDFFKLRALRPLSICLWLLFFQQMTGIEVILVYTVYIFQSAGVRLDPNICTIIVGFVQILATLISALLVDKSGRRWLLIISQIGVSISMLALVIFFHYKNTFPLKMDELDWLPLTSMCCFIAFYALGAGPVPFLLLAELNSSTVIGTASSVATTFTWTCAYLATAFFMDIESSIGFEWCFGFFSLISLVGAIFVWIWVPETSGKSMEEIQNYFRKTAKQGKPENPSTSVR